jgi:hypothetical protein
LDGARLTEIAGCASFGARYWAVDEASVPVAAMRGRGRVSLAAGGVAGTLGDAQKQPEGLPPH